MGLRDRWEMRPATDLALAALIAAAVTTLIDLPDDGSTFYQVAGGTAVALIAFVITPIATLLTLASGRRSEVFDRKFRPAMITAMIWAYSLAIATIIGVLICSAGEPDATAKDPWIWPRAALLGATIAAVSAASRLFVMFVAGLRVRLVDADRPLRNLT